MSESTLHERAESRVTAGFLIHLGVFVAANAGLAALNLARNPAHPWVLWVVCGWGLGLLAHGIGAFMPGLRSRRVESVSSRIQRHREH